MFRGDVPDGAGLAIEHRGKDAIVRRNEEVLVSAHQNGAALGSHSGIHDDDVNRARRKIGVRVGERERTVENVKGNHAVVDVHNSRGGIDV